MSSPFETVALLRVRIKKTPALSERRLSRTCRVVAEPYATSVTLGSVSVWKAPLA